MACADAELKVTFEEAFRAAFNQNVILDAWGGSIQVRISATQTQNDFAYQSPDGLPSAELVDRLAQLQTIEAQSDGVRSFAGIILTLLASQYPLVLLDEPEAFLHPPQARLLGRSLASMQNDGQMVVSTHSLDVLLGLVESRPERVLIIRLTREDGRTTPRVLTPAVLSQIWRDPLLRFSRALDGLFHDGVVVCEGDTDTQFYAAVSDEFSLGGGKHAMFTYAGGKHRIQMVAAALTAVGVPVRVAVDFDAIREEALLVKLVESMGGSMTDEMIQDRNLLSNQLRGHQPVLTVETALLKVTAALGSDVSVPVTRPMANAVAAALEVDAGWPAAKRMGLAGVPPGDASAAAVRLLAALKDQGVWVVPSGAVESFVKDVGGKGPKWVGAVVEGGHLPKATGAAEFVGEILASL